MIKFDKQIEHFTLNGKIISYEDLKLLIEHFAAAANCATGIVLMPLLELWNSIKLKYKCQLNDTPCNNELPSDFDKSLIENDRVTPIYPECSKFCQLVRQSEIGNLRCWWSDLKHCEEAFNLKKVIRYRCHMGLIDMVAAIRIGGWHVANVYAGQIADDIDDDLLEKQYNNLNLVNHSIPFDYFKAARNELRMLDEKQLINAEFLINDLASFVSERATAQATLEVIADIGREISSTLNLREGLEIYLHHTKRLIRSNTGSIWLKKTDNSNQLDPKAIDWALYEQHEKESEKYYTYSMPVGKGLAGTVAATGEKLLCKNRIDIEKIPPHFEDSRYFRDLKCFLGVPMWVGNTLIGVYEVGSNVEGVLNDSDAALLSTLAAHASAFSQTTRVTSTLTDIIAASGIKKLVSEVVEKIPNLINGKGCSLFLREVSGEGPAYLVASQGLIKDLIVEDFFSGHPILVGKAFYEPGEGLTGWVLATGQLLNLEVHKDAEDRNKAIIKLREKYANQNYPQLKWESKFQENSMDIRERKQPKDYFARKAWLGVPLFTENGRVCGVLRISERISGNFTPEEQRILNACAQHISQAIDKESNIAKSQTLLLEILASLASAIEDKDAHMAGHTKKVRDYCFRIGKKMKLKENELFELQIAALLHDIGKIGIEDAVLKKNGDYNKYEKKIMEMHPIIAEDILLMINAMDSIRRAVTQHHERLNGTGYPKGLKGDEISNFAKIIAVADSFEAMTSNRSYSPSMRQEIAFDELRLYIADRYDKEVVNALISIFNE